MASFDVIVVGLGAVGSATTYQLAAAGAHVLGIDRFEPPHAFGSSHGDTRITRLAVGEGPQYVPLVRRSHELWRELESRTGNELLVPCGGLVMGRPGSTGHHGVEQFVSATIDVAVANQIPHEVLGADEIRERFEVFEVHDDEVGYFEPSAGYLDATACIAAQLAVSRELGATLELNSRVRAWSTSGAGVVVDTDSGTHHADRIVIAAGPWVSELVPELTDSCTVQRQVQYWFEIDENLEAFRRLPIYIWMHGTEPGEYVYGFPSREADGSSAKIATERFDAPTTADGVQRAVSDDEIAHMYATHVHRRFRGLSRRRVRSEVCLYTVSHDFGFFIDTHPSSDRVIVASPCSGHGFKHSAAVGECVARLAMGRDSLVDLSPFEIRRT